MMSCMTLSQINQVLNGQMTVDVEFKQVSTDTRSVQAEDLFVALCGEHYNGNKFVAGAKEKNAVAAVVGEHQALDFPQLVVKDTQLALAQIAGLQREQFTAPLIALTGSAGKTSTKEMLASILSECGEVLATKGNLNNEIGVPMTLLQLAPEHQYAVIEMGAANKNDIAYLCQFAKPTIAIVTNALQVHLTGFGNKDVVAKTKGEIYESLSTDGIAVINIDSEYAQQWFEQAAKAKHKTFSLNSAMADVHADKIVEFDEYTEFELCVGEEKISIRLALLGKHNVANALAASAAALAAGANMVAVKNGLEKVKAVAGRLNIIKVSPVLTLIDDTYNANPDAVKVAVDVLAQADEQTCLVLGAMAELGGQEASFHQQMGAYCREKNISHVVAIGPWAEEVVIGFGKGALAFVDVAQFQEAGLPYCQRGKVLVKGSRSSHMERVVEIIKTTLSIKESN